MEKQRAIALYRASTKGQTDKENNNDIPTQRKIVKDFIQNKNWVLIKEFTEGGVSGYKTSEKDRDALQMIKSMAVKKEFDVLVVYMSDRIGRIAKETPLVISFLYQNNVKVWSVTEGEIKSENHTDELLTYIRYWQAEGESRKTSQRVSDYLIEAVKEGRFKGGNCIPLGYMLVDNGNKNFKGRKIKDFVINPNEKELVKLIYYLSLKMNYGQRRIAMYLNENGYTTRGGKPWKSASIQLILSNTIYKGQFSMFSKKYNKTITSPIQEHLIIIPEYEWEENRKIIETRTNKKKSENYEHTRNNHGKLLLSGIIYCGHCGEKLTTFLETKRYKKKDGEITTSYSYRYRCMSFYKRGAVNCDGQSAYGSKKINECVVEETKELMIELGKRDLNKELINSLGKRIEDMKLNKEKNQNNILQQQKEVKVLKDEVIKSLMGSSKFSPDMLKELLEEKENNILIEIDNKNKAELEIKNLQNEIEYYKNAKADVYDWEKKFDNQSDEGKKSMLFSAIDRVTVYRDKANIKYNFKIETFKENSTTSEVQSCTTRYGILTWERDFKF